MVNVDYSNYNLLCDYDNNSIIGFVEDIRQYYKAVAKDNLDLELFDEVIDIVNLLNKIDKKLNKRDLIEVYYRECVDFCLDYKVIRGV